MIKSLTSSTVSNSQDYRSMLAGSVPSSEYLIDTRILDTAVPSITFDNLSQFAGIYKHLRFVISTRTSSAHILSFPNIRFNGDSGTNYSWHVMTGTNGGGVGGATASNETSILFHIANAASSTSSNAYAPAIMDILDFSLTSKNKTIRSFSGVVADGTFNTQIRLFSGHWRNTAAINSVTFFEKTYSGNWLAGSRFSLYGVTA